MGILSSVKDVHLWLEKEAQVRMLKLLHVRFESLGVSNMCCYHDWGRLPIMSLLTIAPLSIQQNNHNLPHLSRRFRNHMSQVSSQCALPRIV